MSDTYLQKMTDNELRAYSRSVKSWIRAVKTYGSDTLASEDMLAQLHRVITDVWTELAVREAREDAHTEALIWNEAIDWHTNR